MAVIIIVTMRNDYLIEQHRPIRLVVIEELCVFCEIRRECINEYLDDWPSLSAAGLSLPVGRVPSRASPREVCGAQSDTGTGRSISTAVYPCQHHSTSAP